MWRENHLLNNSGILNFHENSAPLSPAYFECEKKPSGGRGSHHSADPQRSRQFQKAVKKVAPHVSSSDYAEFSTAESVTSQVCSDLELFDRYAHFDVHALEVVKIREAIVDELNIATPIASFEGTLDEWTEVTKDGLIDSADKFGVTIELPTKEMPRKEELTRSELEDLHRGQIGTIEQQFSRLLDNHRNGVASSETRRVTYDAVLEQRFRRGFQLEGLEDYQKLRKLDQSPRAKGKRKSRPNPAYNPILSQSSLLEQEAQTAQKQRYNSVTSEALG